MTAEDVYRHVNLVQPSLIRVDADEVTYNLHVLIRFELELAIMRDELEVADLPGAWNDAYQRHLGIRPPNDGDGVLQDTHWSGGAFGYFPTYTLGTIYSAMLWDRIAVDLPDIDEPGRGRRVCAIAGLAARARAPARVTVRGRRADRAGHRQRTGSSPADAVSVRQVRSAVRPGGRVSDSPRPVPRTGGDTQPAGRGTGGGRRGDPRACARSGSSPTRTGRGRPSARRSATSTRGSRRLSRAAARSS